MTSTKVPTVVSPSGSSVATASMAVSSTSRIILGVASTGRVPLPHAFAVSSSFTERTFSADIPTVIIVSPSHTPDLKLAVATPGA